MRALGTRCELSYVSDFYIFQFVAIPIYFHMFGLLKVFGGKGD